MLLYQLQDIVLIWRTDMPYSFIQDVPANQAIYEKIRRQRPPLQPGLIGHIAPKHDGGLRYVDVWNSEADWQAFRTAHVEPTVEAVLGSYGIPHDHSLVKTEVVDLVDVWTGTR